MRGNESLVRSVSFFSVTPKRAEAMSDGPSNHDENPFTTPSSGNSNEGDAASHNAVTLASTTVALEGRAAQITGRDEAPVFVRGELIDVPGYSVIRELGRGGMG